MFDTDPTRDFLARLADESRWVVRWGVPIFEPHTRTGPGPDGKPATLTVTPADLPAIADNSNMLLATKGVPGTLTDKHTIRPRADGGGYEPAPDVTLFGFQKDYRVGIYGPHNRPCVLADWFVFPEHAAEVDRRVHRSVEYQPKARVIRGTAVMLNAPFLDLGVVAYEYPVPWRAESSPEHHRALAYMHEHVGTPYDDAVRIVRAASSGDPHPAAVLARASEKPTRYDEALAYMLAHPGMTWTEAHDHITGY
jgi:hypothetical protein